MYTYKDFVSGKIRRTRGRFLRWERGGILMAWGVTFELPMSVLWVPHYLLTPETRAAIPGRP